MNSFWKPSTYTASQEDSHCILMLSKKEYCRLFTLRSVTLSIAHAHCIDGELISRLLGCPVDAVKDKNQRLECGCMTGIDLGLYNTTRCLPIFSDNT